MKKRVVSFVLSAAMLFANVGIVKGANTLEIQDITVDSNTVIVDVKSETGGERCTMLVTKRSESNTNNDNVFAVREGVTDQNGILSFKFKIPDTKENFITDENPKGLTDGEYIVSVKCAGQAPDTDEFLFISSTGKASAIEQFMSAADIETAKVFIAKDSKLRDTYENAGFNFALYDENDNISSDALKIFFDNRPANWTEADEIFNSSVVMALMNAENADIEKILVDAGYEFEDVKYKDSVNKSWLTNAYGQGVPYTNADAFSKLYEKYNALAFLNSSTFDEFDELLRKYSDILDIVDEAEYKEYSSLNSEDMLLTNKNIVTFLSENEIYTSSELLSLIENNITYAPKKNDKVTNQSHGGGFVVSSPEKVEDIAASGKKEETTEKSFTDLGSALWAQEAIEYLYAGNIISGVGDMKYNPDGFVMREEFVKIIVLALDVYNSELTSDFLDVVSGSWYESYVASGCAEELVKGVGGNLFGVGSTITRQDVAVIIHRAADRLGVELAKTGAEIFADDGEISDYAKESVYSLVASDIINGIGENKFDPKGNCTRAQAAKLVYLLLTYSQNRENQSIQSDITFSGTAYADRLKFLQGLGMYGGVSADYFNDDNTILRSKFIQNAMRLVCGDDVADADLLERAKALGIGATENYDYNAEMSVAEALAVLKKFSGMDLLSKYDSTIETDYERDVLKGISSRGTDSITQGEVLNLLYNAAFYEGIAATDLNGGYSIIPNTIIEYERNINRIDGVVTDNELTSIYGETNVSKNEVKIGNVVADVGFSGADEYLGQYVVAYIEFDKENDKNKVIYIDTNASQTDELIISADALINVNTASRKIAYEIGNREKTVSYSPVVSVIKNGKFLSKYNSEELNIANGSLRLVSNNGNNEYDVIFIENYSCIIADGILADKHIIMNAYQSPKSFDFYDVDDFDIVMNGRKITLNDIKQNDVLNIRSTGVKSDDRVTIYVTRDVVIGTVKAIDSADECVIIDGEEYKLSDTYVKAGEYTDSNGEGDSAWTELKLGEQYKVYLDKFGEIAYVEQADSDDIYDYVYVTQISGEDWLDEYSLRCFTLSSEWKLISFADKISYNGERIEKRDIKDKLDELRDLCKVKYNADGEIISLETANDTDSTDVYNKKMLPADVYQWSVNMSGMVKQTADAVENVPVIIDGSCKVMCIPDNGEERDYIVTDKSYFKVDKSYAMTAYELDEFNRAKVVIVNQMPAISYGSDPMIVDDVGISVVDDEVLPVIYGATIGDSNFSAVGDEENVFDGVSTGDLIVMSKSATGRIKEIKILCKASDYGKYVSAYEAESGGSYYNKQTVFAAGFIEDVDYSANMIKLDTGESHSNLLRSGTDTAVFVYDESNETLISGKLTDVVKGDYAFARINWSRANIIYVIRK